MNLEAVPESLRSLKQWVCWRYERRSDDKPTKVPITIGGYGASSTDPADWYSFEDVCAAADQFDGIGFVFSAGDTYLGIDLDNCLRPGGEIAEWAVEILERFDGTYAEISPSGTGIKIWCYGQKPPHSRSQAKTDGGQIEFYSSGRFFTVTANVWDDSPVTDQQPAVDWLVEKYLQPSAASPTSCAPSAPASYSLWQRGLSYVAKAEPAAEGGRNNKAFRLAGHLAALVGDHGEKLSEDQITSLVKQWNIGNTPPLEHDELVGVVASAIRNGSARPAKEPEHRWIEHHPGVDLSGILGSPAPPQPPPVPEAAPPAPKSTGEPFPLELIPTGGLIGEVVRYSLATALYPEPVLAFSGALALAATLFGRKVQDPLRLRTNLYVVAVARTGTGKDHPRKINIRLLAASGAAKILAKDTIVSESGLLKDMALRLCGLYQLDEIGRVLATMGDPRRAPQLYGVGRALLTLWSSADSIIKGAAYADGRETEIDQPHCVVYGSTTPTDFYSSLSGEDIRNGLMNRMIVFEPIEQYPDENANIDTSDPPAELIERIRWWNDFAPNGNLTGGDCQHPSPLTVQATSAAARRISQHRQDIRRRQRSEDEDQAAIWSRSAEKASKLALIHACSRNNESPVIDTEDIDWGVALANHLTRRMVEFSREHVAETKHDSDQKKLLRMFRKHGSLQDGALCVTRTRLLKAMKMPKRQFDELLDGLMESDGIQMCVGESTGGRPPVHYTMPP